MIPTRKLQAAFVIGADITENDGLVGSTTGNLHTVLHPGPRWHFEKPDCSDAARVVIQGMHETVLATRIENVNQSITGC